MKPAVLLVIVSSALAAQQTGPIPFGSALDADRQIAESQQLAKETTRTPAARQGRSAPNVLLPGGEN